MTPMKQAKWLLATVLIFLFSNFSFAQFTQTIRGTVVDQLIKTPAAGATVSIPSLNRSVVTAEDGSFRFNNIPAGLISIQITYIGYKDAMLENITVNTGKEVVLTIPLELDVHVQKEVVVKAKSKKNRVLNDLSVVSSRAFTVEETQRYAAAVNDPLRMATSFAGVVAADDGNNHIVIRGNSPAGLLWRMEGIDIPNPNHFSSAGASGGGISILSSQLLSNSDFVTGAFASEYGNALSGVFDLSLRKGNNEKREYTLQAGILGLNVAAEGPFSSSYKGSYLVNYRYSTLSLLRQVGANIGEGTTNFQDLSYNISLPTRKLGTFSIFGFGGLSSQTYSADRDPVKWETESDRYDFKFISNTGMSGITHNIATGQNSQLRSALAYSYTETEYNEKYLENIDSMTNSYKGNFKNNKITFSTTFNQKFGVRHSLRTGIIVNFISFDYYRKSREKPGEIIKELLNTQDNTQTIQAFAQWQYKPSNNITFNAGLHYLELFYNSTRSVEPRASFKWDINRKNSIALGYGLHSQIQAMGVYFAKTQKPDGSWEYPNKELGLTRSHHFVLSHNYLFSKNLKLRTEIYYQHLFDVPVSTSDTNTFSTVNILGDYITDPLVNKGKGKNYGLELSLEKYLHNNVYFLLSNSFYQSRYTASDKIERNTKFNGNYAGSFTAGKEFVSKSRRPSFGVNIKTIYAGGFRDTPIDLEKSKQKGSTVYREKEAFSLRNPAYFRTDLRVSLKWNRKSMTSTLSLDIQNMTNRQNIFNKSFDAVKGEVVNQYQTGLIPVLNYKVEF